MRFNIRHLLNSFRIRLTLLFVSVSLLLGTAVGVYLERLVDARLTQASIASLSRITKNISTILAENLRERQREITLIARFPLLTQGDLSSVELRNRLEDVKQGTRYYAWMGVTDNTGIVQAAAGRVLEGIDVSQRLWFQQGRSTPFLGDVHEAVLLAKKLPAPNHREPLRFIDFAAPIRDAAGKLRGVLAAHGHWSWVEEIVSGSMPREDVNRGIEIFIVNRDGQFLYPFSAIGKMKLPDAALKRDFNGLLKWDADEVYLTSATSLQTATELGWQVVARQAKSKALAPVAELHSEFVFAGLIGALILMVVAYRAAAAFSKPVMQLAESAQRIDHGEEQALFTIKSGPDEIIRLSAALEGMTRTLIERKLALETSNATLEQTVAERTSELVAANQKLERIARRDALTGLHNRLAANEEIRATFLRMKRTGAIYSVLLMDIDHFKKVNDTYGHETGDEVLIRVADILRRSARETDFVARFGGEEFIGILPNTGATGATVVAEKIRAAVAQSEQPLVGHVTLSVGVAEAGSSDAGAELAIRHADQALYRAKAEGRNRVAVMQTNVN